MKQKTDLTLPEWAFLEATSHLGNTLEGRDILQHIRSYTMLEVFALDDLNVKLNPLIKSKEFTYKNRYGIEEKHIFAIHFSLVADYELDSILNKAIDFYCKYLDWMDKTIEVEDNSKIN